MKKNNTNKNNLPIEITPVTKPILSQELLDTVEKAYNKALKFLSYRPRSEKEIVNFLTKKKFDPQIIIIIIERLKEMDLVNDEEFVKWWIDQRQTHRPKSKYVIKQELKLKGVSEDLITTVIENSSEDDYDIALKLFEKNKHKFEKYTGQEYFQRVAVFLQRRGFSWNIVKKVLDSHKNH